MNWQTASKDDEGRLSVPATWLFPHYYEALTVLFRVENALRLFVYVVLKEGYGANWKDLDIASDEGNSTSIAALAKRRIEQGKTFGYLSYPIQSPLMHLTSGELVRLITNDSYWPAFKEYFPAARNVVTLKLQEIGIIRNALAHFRPLSSNDIDVVKQNANQMLSEVERTLVEVVRCNQNVPTNTDEKWYEELRTIGTENIRIGFSQSSDERWVRIIMRYVHTVVSGSPDPRRSYQHYKVTHVNTPSLLGCFPPLQDRIVSATERLVNLRIAEDLSLKGRKDIRLTFSRRVLTDGHGEVKEALIGALGRINEESDLLREDQLAQGEVVGVRDGTATAHEWEGGKVWSIDTTVLRSKPPNQELPEYWGSAVAGNNFLSDTEQYPWMPVTVSAEASPF